MVRMIEENNLSFPSNWVTAPLQDVVTARKGRKPSILFANFVNDSLPYLDIEAFEHGIIKRYGTINDGVECVDSDLLLVWDGARSGLVGKGIHGLVGSTIMVLTSKGVNPNYLFRFLQLKYKDFNSNTRGTGIPHLDPDFVWNIRVPIPPLAEQERIVTKIEALFLDSKTVRSAISKVPNLLKSVRQAVLLKAFRGELTIRGAEDSMASDFIKEVETLDNGPKKAKRSARHQIVPEQDSMIFQELPDSWAWVKFECVASAQNGRSFPSKFYTESGIRLLRPGNLHVSGRVVWKLENTRYLPEQFSNQYKEFLVGDNEIIMNLTAQSLKDEFLGRVCMTGRGTISLLNQRQARIKPTKVIDPHYLFWVLKSPIFRSYVRGLESGTLIQHMFTWQLNEFMLPLAPLKEQKKIVEKIEDCFSYLDEVERVIEDASNRANNIDWALLSKAFRGELVPQDPNDEPASEALQRMKAVQ
jgi:type I restriction enzyme, S subunit